MATGPQQKRKELREKRLAAESAAKGTDRRQNMVKIIGAAIFVAVIAIVVAIVVSSSGSDEPAKSSGEVDELLAGIPQEGTVLGDPASKVTLIEFGDLQCPSCKQASETIVPDVVSGPVKDGTANFEFQNWAILGEDSVTAARASLAASLQGKYWQFVENFYADQGFENSGYVTDDFLKGIAEKAGVPDIDKWEEDRNDPRWDDDLAATDEQASKLGLTGTPSFAIRDSKGKVEVVPANSADELIKAINQAQ
ncbi:MAG: thioredoxin domain-containing protein [Thermoleophilia bacterium]|nr:thioredoxin domain-containing protein [Thermoleophilia bacterium]